MQVLAEAQTQIIAVLRSLQIDIKWALDAISWKINATEHYRKQKIKLNIWWKIITTYFKYFYIFTNILVTQVQILPL